MRKRLCHFFFCLFLLSASNKTVTAQVKIEGFITDTSGLAIRYATVLLYKDSALINSTATDSLGRYEFKNIYLEKYRLVISRVGFLGLNINIHPTKDTAILSKLQRDNTVLNTVVAYGNKRLARTADRFIYTPDKVITEGNNAMEMMRHVPLIQYDERNNAFSLLGKPGTIVYLNNRKSEMPAEMLAQVLRAMPAENIISIELITNPGSEYTANTTGGIININLKKQLHEGWLGSVSYFFQQGPYAKSIINSYLNYRRKKFGLQITPTITSDYNFYKSNTSLVYANNDKDSIRSTHYRRYYVIGNGLKLDYDINDKSFLSYNGWFSLVYGNSNTNNTTYYRRLTNADMDSLSYMTMEGKDFYIYNYGNINYHRKINAKGSYLDVNIDYNQFLQKRKNNWSFSESKNYQNNLPQRFFNVSGKVEYSQPFEAGLNLLTGLQLSSTNTNNDQRYFTDINGNLVVDDALSVHYRYYEKYYAGFISLSKKFSDIWSVKAGLRLEALNYSTREVLNKISADSNYVTPFPDATVSYTPNKNHQFSLGYAKKIIRPNIELLFPGRTYISQSYFVQNNPFLQPAFRNRLDFSYTLRSKYVFWGFYSVSRNNYASFVLPVEENGFTLYKSSYYNYGKVKSLGLALSIQQTFFKNFWRFYFNPWYDFDRYFGEISGITGKVVNHSYGVYVNNHFNLSKKQKWSAFATFNYRSPINNISGKRLNATSTLELGIKKIVKDFSFYVIASDIYNGGSILRYSQYANYNLKQNLQEYNYYNRAIFFRVTYSFGNNRVKAVKNRSSANDDIRNRVN